jgi:UDP-N-acetylglucosamine transferase subunit ALG13
VGNLAQIFPEGRIWGALVLSTFISLGNARQPFNRLLDAVVGLQEILPRPIVVQHGHTPFVAEKMETIDFVGMEQFMEWLSGAKILILHAGVGAVLQAIETGHLPVVMPRRRVFGEHVDDHQVDFARAMEQQGLVVVANTAEELGVAVWSVLNRAVKPALRKDEPELVALVREALSQVTVRA